MAMFFQSARMPNPSIYKLPLIQAQIQSGICLSTVWYTLAMAGIVVSKRLGLLLESAVLRKGDLLGPRTKGSLKREVRGIVVGAGSEICASVPFHRER